MEDDEVRSSVSRRRIIKRAGVGAAIAWSAPVLTSLGARAYAQTPQPCPPDENCGETEACSAHTPCGPEPQCSCFIQTEGGTFCANDASCRPDMSCNTCAECPPGWGCATTCCTPAGGFAGTCFPPCGVESTAVTAGAGSANL